MLRCISIVRCVNTKSAVRLCRVDCWHPPIRTLSTRHPLFQVTGQNTIDTQQRSSHHYDSAQQQLERRLEEQERKQARRKRYALGGAMLGVFFFSQALCLWNRRSEYKKLNVKLPFIDFDKFKRDYLVVGNVKSLVYQPNFGVVDAYLASTTNEEEQKKRLKHFFSTFTSGPERFAPQPDVRFAYKGTPAELELDVLKAAESLEGPVAIEFEVNSFPSYRELAFILGSSFFGIACVAAAT